VTPGKNGLLLLVCVKPIVRIGAEPAALEGVEELVGKELRGGRVVPGLMAFRLVNPVLRALLGVRRVLVNVITTSRGAARAGPR
jgi:hypothetical protein